MGRGNLQGGRSLYTIPQQPRVPDEASYKFVGLPV